MKFKIKVILSGLLIQACFFSTSVFGVYYYHNDGSNSWTDSFTSSVADNFSFTVTNYTANDYACNVTLLSSNISESRFYFSYEQGCSGVANTSGIYNIFRLLCGLDEEPSDNTNSASCVPVVVDPCVDSDGDKVFMDYEGSATSTINFNGCLYDSCTNTMCTNSGCISVCTGTGVTATGGEPIGTTEAPDATLEDPYVSEVSEPSTSGFDTDTATTDNGDGTTTDVTTDNTSSSGGSGASTSFDGTTVTTSNSDGTQTSTTTTTVTTTQLDGTSTSVTSVNSSTSAGGSTTETTNLSTNLTTTTITAPVTSSTSSGSETSYDADGNVTSQTYSDPSTVIDEPTDPNCASCVPGDENFVNGNFDVVTEGINNLKNPFDTAGMLKPSLSFSLGSLGSCDNTDYQANVLGSVFAPDICTYIVILQSVLYWFFNALTAYYLFTVATSLGRRV